VSRLPRQVRLFGVVSLFNDLASEMVYPLLPAFLTGVLGAGPAALGMLDGAAEMASAGVKLGAGRLADRPRTRGPLVVAGYAIAVLVRPLISLAGAAWHVVGLRVTDRIGKGVRTPPRDAMIADATPPELRGRAFGLQRGLDHVGAVVGPLVAWWLLTAGGFDVPAVIRASIVPGAVVLALAIWAVRGGQGRSGAVEGIPSRPTPTDSYRPASLDRSRPASPLLVIAAFYVLRLPEALLILRAQDLGISVAAVTLLWAALHVVRSAASFAGGELSDRWGAAATLRLGWVAYAALASAFAMARTVTTAWAAFLALGVVAGLTEVPERALIARLSGARAGRGFGGYHAVTGVAALAGGLALGAAYARWGGAAALLASAAGALAVAAVAGIVWNLPHRNAA
jgi:MFS family permease